MAIEQLEGIDLLPKLRLSHPSESTAEVYLHGAHVTSWVPAGGDEVLFLSRDAQFDTGTSIRGGIPVVFPQFADRGSLPKHGFARTQEWTWLKSASADGKTVRATLQLEDNAATRAIWPHGFRALLSVELSERDFKTRLKVTNTGAENFSFTAALHTYLRVADVRQARIVGLAGVEYKDKVADQHGVESEPEFAISGEVDRIYWNAPVRLHVQDREAKRGIRVHSEGFADVVVWNPWKDLARTLPDLGDQEYLVMVCVEAAQIGEPVALQPGEKWEGSQGLQLVEL